MRMPLALGTILACGVSQAASPVVQPATMTVEVTSVRNGAEAGRIVANTRPGERVLLRDEHAMPYRDASGGTKAGTASLPVGLVTVVVPEIREGNLVFSFSTTIRKVSGFEKLAGGVDGPVPAIAQDNYEALLPSTYADGTFTGYQDIKGTGYGVRVKVRALPPKR